MSLASSELYVNAFPVVRSMLAPDALLSEVQTAYALDEPGRCVFLTSGVNDTYLVSTATQQYILRVYLAGWRTLTDILYELDMLHHLDGAGVPISIPVAQRDGSSVSIVQAPEGLRQVVLFTYAPGTKPDRHSATASFAHGKALATLHNATDDFVSSHTRTSLDLALLLDHSLAEIEQMRTGSAPDWAYLRELAERLHAQIADFAARGLDWGPCHGDCHMLNTHTSDTAVTFFDFDCCAPGWRAYELAVLRWCEGFYQMDPEDALWKAFLAGYSERRPIGEIELASIPAFVAVREIWHTALVAHLQQRTGIQGFARLFQRTIRLLRAWEGVQQNP